MCRDDLPSDASVLRSCYPHSSRIFCRSFFSPIFPPIPPATGPSSPVRRRSQSLVTMVWVDNASPEVDAESQYPTIIAICTVLSVLSITIVCARLWIRFKNHGLAADDWMATLSMVFALLYSILCIVRMCMTTSAPSYSYTNAII